MRGKGKNFLRAAAAAWLALLLLAGTACAEAPDSEGSEEAPSLYDDPQDVRECGDYEYIVLPDGTAGIVHFLPFISRIETMPAAAAVTWPDGKE